MGSTGVAIHVPVSAGAKAGVRLPAFLGRTPRISAGSYPSGVSRSSYMLSRSPLVRAW